MNNKYDIGIIGFGKFGQFLAKKFNKYHRVSVSSRSDYSDICDYLNISFYNSLEDLLNCKLDILVISVSINSFKTIFEQLKLHQLSLLNTLIVDVLSVKDYPKELLKTLNLDKFNIDIMCTHPMFGPNHGISWTNLPFVYDKVRISDNIRCNKFLDIFKNEGCKMIQLSSQLHDQYAARTQFITHLTSRILSKLMLEETSIDTQGFKILFDLTNKTNDNSLELFKGIYRYNPHSKKLLKHFKICLEDIEKELNNNE